MAIRLSKKTVVKPPIAPEAYRRLITPTCGHVSGANFFGTLPRTYQRETLQASWNLRAAAILWEPRVGKTKLMLDTALTLYYKGLIDRVLVLAPNQCYDVWGQQAPVHLPSWLPYRAVTLDLAGTTPKKLEALEDELAKTPGLLIVAMNIEGFGHPGGRAKEWAERFLLGGRALLIVDESQRIRNPTGVRTKVITALAPLAHFRRILTGTAIPKGYHNLYAQYRFLDPHIIGVRTYTEFKAEYCEMGGFERKEVVDYKNIPKLMKKIAPVTFARKRSECFEVLQDEIDYAVELSPQQRTLYNSVRDELLVILSHDAVITSPVAATRHIRLRQILSGFVRIENPDTGEFRTEILPSPRIDAAIELAEMAPDKTIIWCAFQEEVERVVNDFIKAGLTAVRHDGGIPKKQRDAHIAEWRKTEGPNHLVATLDTMSVGITLDEASVMIFMSHTYNQEFRAQGRERNASAAQKNRLLIYNLVAKKTLDPLIVAVAKNAMQMSETVHNPVVFREWLKNPPQ